MPNDSAKFVDDGEIIVNVVGESSTNLLGFFPALDPVCLSPRHSSIHPSIDPFIYPSIHSFRSCVGVEYVVLTGPLSPIWQVFPYNPNMFVFCLDGKLAYTNKFESVWCL